MTMIKNFEDAMNATSTQKIIMTITAMVYVFDIRNFDLTLHTGLERSFLILALSAVMTAGIFIPAIKVLHRAEVIKEIPGFCRKIRSAYEVSKTTYLPANTTATFYGIRDEIQLNVAMILVCSFTMSTIITTLLLIGKN